MTVSRTTARTLINLARNGDLNALGDLLRAIIRGEPYQTAAGVPTVTPENIGDRYFDSTNLVFYRAIGTTSADWAVDQASGKPIRALAVTTVLTAADFGRTIFMSGAGGARTFTLPAPTGSGGEIEFIVAEVNTSNYLIKAAAGTQLMKGMIIAQSATDSATDAPRTYVPGATDDTITLNGTTTGGKDIGNRIMIKDCSATHWNVTGFITISGSEATPFSDTVT